MKDNKPPVLHERSGLWFPECTARVDAEYDYMLKRVTDVDLAVKVCRKRRVAVQAGGNVGMWPLRIAKFFPIVHTFEAVPYYVDALRRNVSHVPGITVHAGLLSSSVGIAVPFSERADGRSRAVPEGEANATPIATTIDALELPTCDALFLDVEGHEMHALEGARRTIERCRPVITIEVWEKDAAERDRFFLGLKYVLSAKVHADRIYVPTGGKS